MRKISVEDVLPGMRLAKAAFNTEGRLLLTSGMELKDIYLDRLRNNDIKEIFIEEGIIRRSNLVLFQNEATRQDAKAIIKHLMKSRSFKLSAYLKKAQATINKIFDDILANDDIISILSDIKSVDDYTFEHSVNVCVISLIIGIGLGYNITRLMDLGIGSILHDIGKLNIREEVLKKPGRLTNDEFDEIKKHTVYGYEILRNCSSISMVSAFIAFGHHERFDGSGYPLQLKGENIHQCARIVAIADVYDALTSDRVYRKKLGPHEVLEYITTLVTHQFDCEMVESFVKFIVLYPAGTGVILNTMERGIVIKANEAHPTRPRIKLLNSKGNEPVKYQEINLAENSSVHIVDTYEL